MPASDAQQLNGLIEKIVSNKDAFYIWEKILYRYQNGCLTDVIKKVEASNAIEKQFKDVKKQFKDCVVPQQQLNDAQTQFKDVKKQCEDAIKQLRDAIEPLKESIVANNAQEILFDIVWNQFEANIKKGLDPRNEGFHVPQPWNGDINAPVLFLGSNPGFTPRAYSPRYFGGGRFRWNGTQFGDSGEIAYGIKGVRDFFNKRFQKDAYSVVKAVGKFTVKLDNGKEKRSGVPYWDNMYKFLQQLYTLEQKPGETNEKTRRVMEKGVCTEVIPFVSQDEKKLTPELYAYCWKKFSSQILNLSGASLIVLAGKGARDVFLEVAFLQDDESPSVSLIDANGMIQDRTNAGDALLKGKILNLEILNCGSNGEAKKVIAIKHLSYRYGKAELPPDPDFSELRKELGL